MWGILVGSRLFSPPGLPGEAAIFQGSCYTMTHTVSFMSCVSIFHPSCFPVRSHWPLPAPWSGPLWIRNGNVGICSGDEAGKVCQAKMKMVSKPSIRAMVLSYRPGEPQLMRALKALPSHAGIL